MFFRQVYSLFNRSTKSKNFTKDKGNEFVLTAKPRMSGYGSGYGSGNGYSSTYTQSSYSMDGIKKVGKFLKDNISKVNKLVSDAIGPCKVKVGDLYHGNQYITLIITMK